jgi:hypothetical protein
LRRPPAAEQSAEKVALQSEERASAAKAGLILWHLRRGLKPRPFKTKSKLEFSADREAEPVLQIYGMTEIMP